MWEMGMQVRVLLAAPFDLLLQFTAISQRPASPVHSAVGPRQGGIASDRWADDDRRKWALAAESMRCPGNSPEQKLQGRDDQER